MFYEKHNLIEKVVLVGFCFSGMAALIYEVAWTNALSPVIGSTTYAMSTMLAAFMAGLSLGGFFGGIIADRSKNPIQTFAFLESLTAVFGLLTFYLIKSSTPLYAWIFFTFDLSFSGFSVLQFLMVFLIMLVPTTLMGMTLPVVLKSRAKKTEYFGYESGVAYAANNFGAIMGSMAAGFILIPAFGISMSNMTASVVNIIIAISIFALMKEKKIIYWSVVLVYIVLALLFFFRLDAPKYELGYYDLTRYSSVESFDIQKSNYDILYSEEGLYGTTRVLRFNDDVYLLQTNGKIEGSVNRGALDGKIALKDEANQKLLSYLPLEVNKNARQYLNIGLGTGETVFKALKYENLENIDSVEINPNVIDVVKKYFFPEIFTDKRVNLIVGDARNYLNLTKKKYDVIVNEPSYPVDKGITYLFTKEFFDIVNSHLNENGVFVQWLPGYLLTKDDFTMMLSTFDSVFTQMHIWDINGSDVIIMGMNKENTIDEESLKKAINIREGADITSSLKYVMNSDSFSEYAKSSGLEKVILTDDKPVLEFNASKMMINMQ